MEPRKNLFLEMHEPNKKTLPVSLFLLLVLCAASFLASIHYILRAPIEPTMGLIQRIFYFHVPCAWVAMLAAVLCGIASLSFLLRPSDRADRWAVSTAELSVIFGLCVLVTGPLWAKKAWGAYWQWDVRLTTTLLLWIVFVMYLFSRKYAGPSGKRLAAALAVFGMVDVPLIYISVSWWRTIHPKTSVVPTLQAGMKVAFWVSMAAFTLLFGLLLWLRIRLEKAQQICSALELELDEPLDSFQGDLS